MRRRNQSKKSRFHCHSCDIKFSSRSERENHINNVHEGKKPTTCKMCSKEFSSVGNLNCQVKGAHEKIKPFVCELCPILTHLQEISWINAYNHK